jgi:PPOX class probable FMN-dependent enzyme
MDRIETIDALEALFGAPSPASLTKVTDHVTPLYRQWIEASKFCVLTTVGPDGTDGSPRGDAGPVVQIADMKTVLMPDWRGNNRLDSLRNIVRDGRVSLMFMVPGSANVVRLNGRAVLTAEAGLRGRFEQGGKQPKVVIVITVEQLYFQCAKAILRSELWSGEAAPEVPTAGDFVREMDAGFDAESYDAGYPEYAKSRMW